MIRKLKSDKNKEVYFERFDKMLKKRGNKVDFSEMSPYEIINYLREREVRKNYKVLPSNKFIKRTSFISFCMILLIFSYGVSGSSSIINKNIQILVNKIDGKSNNSDIINNSIDYIVRGDFTSLIDIYRQEASSSIESHFELVTMLSSINNFSQGKDELSNLKSKVEQSVLIRSHADYKNSVYKLLDNLLLYNNLDSAKEVLDKNYQSFGSEVIFKEKSIMYNLLSDNVDEALSIYNSMELSTIENVEDIVSYSKLSVILNRFDNAINGINKILLKDNENVDILSIIDMMIYNDLNKFNSSLNSIMEQNPNSVELRLVRAIGNLKDLSNTQVNLEDVDSYSKKHVDNILAKSIKLDILTSSNRLDEALIIVNEFKPIKDDNFYVSYSLANYNLKIQNYNEALNYIKDSLRLNRDFTLSYDVLLKILIHQNKALNINYFYLKMKSLDMLNTYIDKEFIVRYNSDFNDYNRSLEILDFANKISRYEAGLKYQTAQIYIDLRKDNEAKEKLYEAISLSDDSIYVRTLGVLLISMGEVDLGIENIRRAYEMNPNDILNLNNAGAYYANIEKNVQRAFSNIKAAYEGLDDSHSEYEAFIIRENYFKLESMYDETTGEVTGDTIPFVDYLY